MRRYNMSARYLHDLISGAEMDLTVQTYPTFDRLREYCYRVAGTVGLTCTHVFGFNDPRALDLAEKLGLAFQLTNIIRDVHDDDALGRVYIPEEDLERYGVSPQDFGRGEATLGVRELLRFEADRAWQCYDEGAALLNLIDLKAAPRCGCSPAPTARYSRASNRWTSPYLESTCVFPAPKKCYSSPRPDSGA